MDVGGDGGLSEFGLQLRGVVVPGGETGPGADRVPMTAYSGANGCIRLPLQDPAPACVLLSDAEPIGAFNTDSRRLCNGRCLLCSRPSRLQTRRFLRLLPGVWVPAHPRRERAVGRAVFPCHDLPIVLRWRVPAGLLDAPGQSQQRLEPLLCGTSSLPDPVVVAHLGHAVIFARHRGPVNLPPCPTPPATPRAATDPS